MGFVSGSTQYLCTNNFQARWDDSTACSVIYFMDFPVILQYSLNCDAEFKNLIQCNQRLFELIYDEFKVRIQIICETGFFESSKGFENFNKAGNIISVVLSSQIFQKTIIVK